METSQEWGSGSIAWAWKVLGKTPQVSVDLMPLLADTRQPASNDRDTIIKSMTLFDLSSIQPEKTGPMAYNEPDYCYLQSSAHPVAAKVRALLETWFAAYPNEHKYEMRQRFRTSKSDIDSPVFELALFATLRAVGARVEIHPKVSDRTNRRPDFLVCLPSGYEFYLEAALARGQTDEERSKEMIEKQFKTYINKNLITPGYLWTVTVLSQGSREPRYSRCVKELSQYAKRLNPAQVLESLKEYGFSTTKWFTFEDAGWRVHFTPTPVKESAIGLPGHRPIGSQRMPSAAFCKDHEDIRRKVEDKAQHHDLVDKPIVVAVNACSWRVTQADIIDALYGMSQLTVTTFEDGSHTFKGTRAPDGVWFGKEGARRPNLIAVLGVCKFTASGAGQARFTLYENPYIPYPPEARISELSRYEVRGDRMEHVEGKTIGQLFCLPPSWPLDADCFDR